MSGMIRVDSGTIDSGSAPAFSQSNFDSYMTLAAQNRYAEGMLWTRVSIAALVLLAVVLIVAWRYRRRLARAGYDGLVSTLAFGVRIRRRQAARIAALRQEVKDHLGD